MSSLGKAGHAQPEFSSEQALCGAGVLFLLPALISQGLLKTKEVYQLPASHYYGVESVVMTLAFMALSRIKNPEQLKLCKPGEIGRLIGLDRIPEMKCLREKIKLLSEQNQSTQLNNSLIDSWYTQDNQSEANFLYIDGHVRIYYGSKANLPSKFISRQKLCLSATSEFWVNDAKGMPVMMVMGELTEKLQTVIESQIIPRLIGANLISDKAYPFDKAQCTLVFDREAYEPAFFQRLWERYRIATLTYRKNVKDIWDNECFESVDVKVMGQQINMDLCEQKAELGGYIFREVRRLSANGHQTAIITNNPEIQTKEVAGRMFARWSQENFFRYLIQDYDFDKMVSYGIETIDMEKVVVNPQYRKLTHQLKKIREKKQRVEAKFYPLVEQAIEEKLDNIPAITDKQMQYKQQIDQLITQENELNRARKSLQPKIKLAQMPQEKRYNKLKTESKILMNVIKMICYRAESSVATLLAPYLANADKEKRMVVKQIIQSNADLIVDYKEQTMTVKLYSLAAKRYNLAVENIVQLLNDTETIFPGTSLKLVFTISSAV
jgi:prepilin-type processing-associated H-X9-DG protein